MVELVDVVVRDAARNAVAIIPSVTQAEAETLVAGWFDSGAVAEALSVEVTRELPGRVEVETLASFAAGVGVDVFALVDGAA